MEKKKAILYLEDGTCFYGQSDGAYGETVGEMVFNTSMSGYLEMMTDASYNGQILLLTYPLIGNYGVCLEDTEHSRPWARGLVIREMCEAPSNWRCDISFGEYLKSNGIVAISGVDTRAITFKIREKGCMVSVISTQCFDTEELGKRIEEFKNTKENLVAQASTKEPQKISDGNPRVAVYDFGSKNSILGQLTSKGAGVTVFPYNTSAEEILSQNFDGVVFSNGPGDPKDVPEAIENAKKLFGKVPVAGICLGHQIIGLALGGDTYKLKFGHHGANHPVKDTITGHVHITSQNHNYALKNEMSEDVEITHINLNDNTVEGLRHKKYPVISLQYHPEAAPGPNENYYIFDEFISMFKKL